jgi:hypothetical protein
VIAGVALVGVLVLAIVGGVVAYRSLYPSVPDLVGQTESAAKQSAGEDFEVKVGDKQPSDKAKETVLSQDPGARERARRGSTISVVTSAGGDIFHDDFSTTSNGWPRHTFDDGSLVDYDNGAYRMLDVTPDDTQTVTIDAAGTVKDAIVEVDAARTDNTPNNAFTGVTCRFVDKNNNYFFGVSSDGNPVIAKKKSGKTSVLAGGSTTSDAIRKNKGTNHIRGDCVGSKLTLYVNDQKLLEASDSDLDSGKVGLFVDTDKDNKPPGVDISFDNFLVSNPPTSSGTRL